MDFGIFICSEIMELELKWVHMARYGLILKQDGAIRLRIISKPLLTPEGAIKDQRKPTTNLKVCSKPAKHILES